MFKSLLKRLKMYKYAMQENKTRIPKVTCINKPKICQYGTTKKKSRSDIFVSNNENSRLHGMDESFYKQLINIFIKFINIHFALVRICNGCKYIPLNDKYLFLHFKTQTLERKSVFFFEKMKIFYILFLPHPNIF